MACSECNDLLVAPKESAYVSNHEVRHVWSCENCGHEIEMAVNLTFRLQRPMNRRAPVY
jgi:RNase P subunit RPR2